MKTTINIIGVVGAGQMGRGIAQVCLVAGKRVSLSDQSCKSLETAEHGLRFGIDKMVAKGLCPPSVRDSFPLTTGTDLNLHLECDLLIEAVPENISIKQEIFLALEKIITPHTTLCSNTSSISLTTMASFLRYPERLVGMHFFNPVHRMALVEVIPTPHSAPDHISRVTQYAKELGKTPCVVKDSPGFAANRILLPMINEAVYCLDEGIATTKDIDTIMRLGMSHPMGPLQLADVIGLDTCLSILEILYKDLDNPKYRPCPLLRRMVADGHLGKKSGQGFYTYAAQ